MIKNGFYCLKEFIQYDQQKKIAVMILDNQ